MDKYERRGTFAGTTHAQEQLKKRYGLEYPLSDFLRWIAEGRATEVSDPKGNRPRTRVYDVDAPGNSVHPAQTIRCVIGYGATSNFVVTFLPLKWVSEMISERTGIRAKRKRGHFKEFRRINADEESIFEVQL